MAELQLAAIAAAIAEAARRAPPFREFCAEANNVRMIARHAICLHELPT
jgi:hypothetical protein